MKITDLRKAVEIMDESQLLDLGAYYESMVGCRDEDASNYYRLRLTVVETEMDKAERPKVDRKLAQKPNYWKGL